ncbi:Major facilitator superfamily (MFS) profile domain-containing protein [Caenorhabditis elegans]|uniref:Major facilitator superfamily (MFS) profile domain-containing protein n=1 Tax=Caenorhabditis elegans TaxID=6239 RepID=Q23012_CAEEL|nr:Major facilitator superfamily (MFS) profile domain-containing protein [Caenorhabditis elegans]CCD72927.1 Major facilitator superfamily (MFS) profile domain-containing protein [Caenorhabditis elegans]|eukprot:NP_504695.2 Uncharacterized protein CELE_K11G9.5 [Caenorhabditis elegans]
MSIISNKYRVLVVFIGFLCLVSVCSNYVVMNFTFICMKNDMSFTRDDRGNETSPVSLFDYTPNEKKYIMWAVAAGTIIGTFPVNYVFVRFGGRWTFFLAGVISVIATTLIPLAAQTSFHALLAARFCQGLAFAADFAAIGLLTVRWAPLSETAIFLGALTSFTNFSSVLTNAVSGAICEGFGWRTAFYAHAVMGSVFFILWAIVYNDDPEKKVSADELRKIRKNKSEQHLKTKNVEVPYRKLLTSPIVLCVWLNAFAEMSIIVFLHTYAPIFFNRILKFSVAQTGFLLALSVFIPLPLKLVGGIISDKAKCFSERGKMLFFNTISVGLVGVLLGCLGFIPQSLHYVSVVLFSVIFSCLCLNVAGFYKCATLHTRQFAHVVISTIQWMKSVALITGPALVAAIVKNEESVGQWRTVLCILGGIMFVANILALCVFTDKPAEYTMADANEKTVKYEVNAEEP